MSDDGERINSVYAKGVFRHNGIKPLPGDIVYLREDENGHVISSVQDRKNAFVRPALSNLDILYITLSCKAPDPSQILTDKMTVICENSDIKPVIVITKSELDKEKAIERTVLEIRDRFGKNAVLRGINLNKAGTQRERNTFIGGHRAGNDDPRKPRETVSTL